MNCKKIIKRISIFFLCFLLLSFAVLSCYQKTTKAAVPLVAGAALIVSALSAYMAASGVNIASNSNSDGADVVAMWEDICAEYQSDGKTLESWYGEAGSAVNILVGKENAQKFAIASTSLCNWFDGLREWLTNQYDLNSTAPVTISGSSYFTDGNGRQIPYIQKTGNGGGITVAQYYDGYTLFPIDNTTPVNSSFIFKIASYTYQLSVASNNPTYTSNYGRMGFVLHNYSTGSQSTSYSTYYYGNQGENKLLFVYNGSNLYLNVYSKSANYNTITTGSQILNLSVTNLDTSNISVTGVLSDGYQDLQDALNDAQTDAGANGKIGIDIGDWDYTGSNTKEGVAEAYLDRIAATGTAEGTLTGGYTDEKEAEDETDADFVPSAAWYEKNIIVVDGLEDFFPFCIPFDLYEIVRLLNVPAEAPKFNWKMNFGNTGISDYDIEIDLTPYETIAIIFRTLIIIGFLVFLTIKTRDLIRG